MHNHEPFTSLLEASTFDFYTAISVTKKKKNFTMKQKSIQSFQLIDEYFHISPETLCKK